MRDPLDSENSQYDDLGAPSCVSCSQLALLLGVRLRQLGVGGVTMQRVQLAYRTLTDVRQRLLMDAEFHPLSALAAGGSDQQRRLKMAVLQVCLGARLVSGAELSEVAGWCARESLDRDVQATGTSAYGAFERWPRADGQGSGE